MLFVSSPTLRITNLEILLLLPLDDFPHKSKDIISIMYAAHDFPVFNNR